MGSFRTADTVRIPYQDEPMVGAFVCNMESRKRTLNNNPKAPAGLAMLSDHTLSRHLCKLEVR